MGVQKKRGYLRGCRGLLLTAINEDGSTMGNPTTQWVDTAQEANIETEIIEGESSDLRGGDRLLTQVQENDVIVGVNIDFKDARFDAEATKIVQGGTLIVDSSSGTEEIIGWEAPKIADQGKKHAFKADLYVQSFNAEGGREAYLKYIFPYCTGNMGSISHSDQNWGTPEFSVKARENPSTGASAYSKRFVDDLPDVPFSIGQSVIGATASLVLKVDGTTVAATVMSGATVTVLIDDIQTGHKFRALDVRTSTNDAVGTTEVTAGEVYTFIMPKASVMVTLTLEEDSE